MESKKDIRKKIFAERKLRTDEQIEAMSLTITDKVTALPAFKNADRILVYADYNHEVVTEYLIKEAWKAGKEVAVPKVVGKDILRNIRSLKELPLHFLFRCCRRFPQNLLISVRRS